MASALRERLVDRVVWCIAPLVIGGREAVPSVGGRGIDRLPDAIKLTDVSAARLGADIVIAGTPVYKRGTGHGARD